MDRLGCSAVTLQPTNDKVTKLQGNSKNCLKRGEKLWLLLVGDFKQELEVFRNPEGHKNECKVP